MDTDLVVSPADRCNLRCIYCMPKDGMQCRRQAGHTWFWAII